MANLEKLISDHAYWSDKRRELKAAGSMQYDMCEQITSAYTTCLDKAHEIMLAYQQENQTYYTYDEAFTDGMDEDGEEWEPCVHCIEVRRLKAERVKAGRKLGGIRAAITRIGRTINEASL